MADGEQMMHEAEEKMTETMATLMDHGTDVIHCIIGMIFFAVGICGIWMHGLNVKRLMKLDLILPQGFVSLHFHLSLANLGVVVGFVFSGLSTIFNRWLFGDVGCQMYAFEGMICGITSILLTCTICFLQNVEEKYGMKVTRAMYHQIAIGCWAFGFLWAILPVFHVGNYDLEMHQTSCALELADRTPLSILYLILVSIFCYVIPVGAAIGSFWVVGSKVTEKSTEKTTKKQETDSSWTNSLNAETAPQTSLENQDSRNEIEDKAEDAKPEKKDVEGEYSMMNYTSTQDGPVEDKKITTKDEKHTLCTKLNGRILLFSCMTWMPMVTLTGLTLLFGKLNCSPLVYYMPQLAAKLGCAITPIAYASTLNQLQRQRSSINLETMTNKDE